MTPAAGVTTRRPRSAVIGTVLALIGAPALLAGIEAAHFYVHNGSDRSIVSSGVRREYLLYVPESYDRATPTPLIISMHGAGLWGAAQREMSRWNGVADAHGFIVAYPSGTGFPRIWHVQQPGPALDADVRFVAELIDTVSAAYNVDPSGVYVDGLSNGGGMAFVLSCTLADRIAAVGIVASAQFLPWSWCPDRRPMPMIAFHGTADPVTPYAGGTTWVSPMRLPAIPAWTAEWARRNRCAAEPVDSRVAPDVVRSGYNDCADDAAVVLYTVIGGGHSWPGGAPPPEWLAGTTSTSVDAASELWTFYRAHPRRPARSPAR